MQSVFLNGGMIGTTLDFDTTDQYILSTSQQRVRPTFVGNQFFGRSGSTSSTTVGFALSAGTGETVPQAGDLVLLTIAHGAVLTTLMSAPTDYTQLARFAASNTNNTVLYVGYKIMGSTPDTTFPVVSSISTANAQTAIVFVFRGVDPTNPIDVTTTTATAGNSRRADPPAITPITQNSTVVAIGAGGHTASSVNYTTTDLTNFKTLFSTDTYDIVHGAGYFEWTSGAVNPAAFSATSDSTDDSWCSATVALRPALADVPVYGNLKNSGIWALQTVFQNIYKPKLAFGAGSVNTTDASSYTFSSINISTAQLNRYVVVFVQTRVNNPSMSSTSCTVAGQACSMITGAPLTGQDSETGTGTYLMAFVTNAPVTSGTTANIVVTMPATTASCRISTYALYTYNTRVPYYYAGTVGSATNPQTINSPLKSGQVGFVMANGGTLSGLTSMSFTGPATANYNSGVAESSLIITATLTGAGDITFTPVGSGSLSRAAILIWA
jgi:hypothetical protein